ncbi:MAG: hypothetical protein II771_06145 [Clostridia bacterium]|nr:hypothetical protein [Clostridia bacterium]
MKKAWFLVLTFLMVFSLVACSSPEKEAAKAAAGTYKGVHLKPVGDSEWVTETFSLELNANGTGTHNRDEMSFKVTWTLDGDKFTMNETFIGDPIVYTGTLKDGKLDLFNGDPTNLFTYEYVYEKQ